MGPGGPRAVDRAAAPRPRSRRGYRRAVPRTPRVPAVVADDVEWLTEWAARPVMRGWLHAAAVPVVAGATAYAATRAPTRSARVAVGVYAGSVTAMVSASAAYHRLTRTPGQARVLRRADHVAIFAAVAGTMTPIAVASLPPRVAAAALTGMWGAAAAGMVTKFAYMDRSPSTGSWLYATLGWLGAGLVIPVARRSGWVAAGELAAGGVVYSVGAALFRAKRPDPFPGVFGYHEVWHTFVLAGVGLHLDAVRRVVAEPPAVPTRREAAAARLRSLREAGGSGRSVTAAPPGRPGARRRRR